MIFGTDMFKIIRFIIAIMKLLAEIFGDDDDKTSANENGFGKEG